MISPEKTAISNGVSLSCKEIIRDLNGSGDSSFSILDYGCGKLRNSRYIIENNYTVDIIETEKQLNNIQTLINELKIMSFFNTKNIPIHNKYDIILSSFVLNVIPDIETRTDILKNIYKMMDDKSYLYIEVRNTSFIKNLKTKTPYNDGFITGRGSIKTFQKGYTKEEFILILESMNFNIVKCKVTSGSIFIKANKKEYLNEF